MIIENLVKYFGDDRAVDGISFAISEGKFLTLLGPSGCGKTTTLMCIAGLHKPDSGEIRVGGKSFTSLNENIFLEPEKRDIGMVFQSYAIWPHMTVEKNISYPLEIRNFESSEIEDRVMEVARLVGLDDMVGKDATQLSGGQQQRAALARAIVCNPSLLLFDEPLSNLDLKLRERMRLELKRIQNEVGITSVYVTHDQAEALVMSDDIIVMSKGKIEQSGGPHSIYARPVNRYVSNFIGVANLLKGKISSVSKTGLSEINISQDGKNILMPCVLDDKKFREGDNAVLSIRPENVYALREKPEGTAIEGEVIQTVFLGNYIDCRVQWGKFEWKVQAHPRERLKKGDHVYIRLDSNHSMAVLP
ncbi:MAG: ABC transporter ATP-binding protein [Nitrospinota bacterium]|nr:ABC transporter ATP-binding protein [Nitrospinota bacterium]